MARLGFDGAEFGQATNLDPGLQGATIVSTNPRTGTYCWQAANAGESIVFGGTGTLDRSYFVRLYVRFSSVSLASAQQFLSPWDGTLFTTFNVQMETNGTLTLRDSTNAQVGSASPALLANTYYRIEFEWKVPTAGSGTLGLYLNGDQIARSTAASTGNTAKTEIDMGRQGAGGGVLTLLMDDFAINDDTGTEQLWLPGPGAVGIAKPISDNARVGFTGGAGGTTSLFDAVNNFPALGVVSPGTNLQEIGDATNNATDTYDANLGAYTTAVGSGGVGMGTGDVVTVVQAFARGGNSTTTTRNFGVSGVSNPAVTEVTKATGTTAAGTERTGWNTVKSAVVYRPTVTLGTSPVLRVRKATASTDRILIDQMGMNVEYLPKAAPPHRGALSARPAPAQMGAVMP